MSRISDRLRRQVRAAAGGWCEYCHLPESVEAAPFPIDHIIARQHRGETTFLNLALSCIYCNAHKGTNVSGIDPLTKQLSALYHPRRDQWPAHFRWDGFELAGLTPPGRCTIYVLKINDLANIAARRSLREEGFF